MRRGVGVTGVIAIGKAYVLPELNTQQLPAVTDDAEREVERLSAAVAASRTQLAAIGAQADEETASIMAAHMTFLEDDSFNSHVMEMIRSHGYTAVRAIEIKARELRQMFSAMEDDYMRERASDINDVSDRVIRNLLGEPENLLARLSAGSIIVAQDLVPSQAARLSQSCVAGFVTEKGGKTSHTAIIARTLGLAAVVSCKGILAQVKTGDLLIVNAVSGEVFICPTEEQIDRNRKLSKEYEKLSTLAETAKGWALERNDGGPVQVLANIGSVEEAKQAKACGADGIGLFRSEFPFMYRRAMPTEEEQFQAYKSVTELFNPAPVIVRTLDIGGDKRLTYLDMPEEENPFLGLRGIRLCLRHEALFRTQLRALLRAASHGNLKIMFPMISHLSELRQAKALLAQCRQELVDEGHLISDVPVGMMVEIPAAALCAAEFAAEVDFFSIGTNDLVQYTLAADRGGGELSELYDERHPAVLRLIADTIGAARQAGIPCGVCGEMAGDPAAIGTLCAHGLDAYSVAPAIIGRTKCSLLTQDTVRSAQADEDFLQRLRC